MGDRVDTRPRAASHVARPCDPVAHDATGLIARTELNGVEQWVIRSDPISSMILRLPSSFGPVAGARILSLRAQRAGPRTGSDLYPLGGGGRI